MNDVTVETVEVPGFASGVVTVWVGRSGQHSYTVCFDGSPIGDVSEGTPGSWFVRIDGSNSFVQRYETRDEAVAVLASIYAILAR